jgi:cytochrome c-type biogenesis protein CcmH/NrfF
MHSVTSATSATAVSCDNALREPLALLEGRFAEGSVEVPGGRVSYRSCGSGPVVVLLHGISSGAASWLQCALKLESQARVIAWNAPGYGRSTPLTISQPKAVDYARRLQDMLQALEVEQCVLVGHSLGALMAAAYLAHGDGRARRTLLADPALEARARDLSKGLRCLVCQNQSIDDSDADLARDLRIILRERLTAGDSDAQVIAFLTARYGDFVLLRPPVKPETYALWFGPVAVLLLAVAGVAMWLRRRGAAPAEPAPLTQDEQTRLAALARDDDR